MFYTYSYKLNPVYSITGYGGECIRNNWNYTKEDFINIKKHQANRFSSDLVSSMENIVQNSFTDLEKEFEGIITPKSLYDTVRSNG